MVHGLVAKAAIVGGKWAAGKVLTGAFNKCAQALGVGQDQQAEANAQANADLKHTDKGPSMDF